MFGLLNGRSAKTPSNNAKSGWRKCTLELLEVRSLLSATGIEGIDMPSLIDGANGGSSSGTASAHYTYESMKTQLESWAADHSDICTLVRIGDAVQKYADPIPNDPFPETTRGLWAVKISDHVNVSDDGGKQYEPDVKYIGTMHGNEPLGMEMCMRFIGEVLTNYTTRPSTAEQTEIKTLVDNSEIWVLPVMNPDGFANATRTNYNGYDLNRSFPDISTVNPYDAVKPTLSELEKSLPTKKQGKSTVCAVPEVKAVMDWSAQHEFVLAANFHTGNLVVNYPYDDAVDAVSGKPAISPDDGLYQSLSHIYADDNTYMLNNSPYPGGITNGAAWFVASGTMQDFDYRYFATKHVTVELYAGYDYGTKKTPIDINQQWVNNRQAMLDYLYEGTPMVDRNARWIATSSSSGTNVTAQSASQPTATAMLSRGSDASLVAVGELSVLHQSQNKHFSDLFGLDDFELDSILSPDAVDKALAMG